MKAELQSRNKWDSGRISWDMDALESLRQLYPSFQHYKANLRIGTENHFADTAFLIGGHHCFQIRYVPSLLDTQ